MDIRSIVSELKDERNLIDQAIRILEASSIPSNRTRDRHRTAASAPYTGSSVRHGHPGASRLTPEGRRRLSQLMKRRWAERRRKAA